MPLNIEKLLFQAPTATYLTLFTLLVAFSSAMFSSTPMAATSTNTQISFDNWVERVKKQAQHQGISNITLDNVFSNVKQLHAPRPKNKTNSLNISRNSSSNQLINHSLTERRINTNKRLVDHYSDVLFEIKHLFGVNPEAIIALWGVDNLQNQNKKRHSAIDVLTSLSYRQPSNANIKNELFQALKIIDDGQASTLQLKSDAYGHLGATFFKPTTFRDYAVDYDGDGNIDIWQNHADIFASTANYLSSIGWKAGEPWGIAIKLPLLFDAKQSGLNQQKKISQWQALGVRMPDGSDLPEDMLTTNMGSIIQPDSGSFQSYLVFDNYFALLRWKRSQPFAFAVGMMIDKIKQPIEATPMAPFANILQ